AEPTESIGGLRGIDEAPQPAGLAVTGELSEPHGRSQGRVAVLAEDLALERGTGRQLDTDLDGTAAADRCGDPGRGHESARRGTDHHRSVGDAPDLHPPERAGDTLRRRHPPAEVDDAGARLPRPACLGPGPGDRTVELVPHEYPEL